MKEITLIVTEADVRNGEPENACDCPVGLALQRLLADAYDVAVDPADYGVIVNGHVICAEVPAVIREFVTWFDSPAQVQSGLDRPVSADGGFSVRLAIAPEHEYLFKPELLTEVRA